MDAVTDVDRKAAEELRVLLADLSGFWFTPGDTGPLCAALARHRAQCEVHLLEKISHSGVRATIADGAPAVSEPSMPAAYEARPQRARSALRL